MKEEATQNIYSVILCEWDPDDLGGKIDIIAHPEVLIRRSKVPRELIFIKRSLQRYKQVFINNLVQVEI